MNEVTTSHVVHPRQHPLAGKAVLADQPIYNAVRHEWLSGPHEFIIEDWADRVLGGSIWGDRDQYPYVISNYALIAGRMMLPPDNEIVYGKVGNLSHLIHVSRLMEVVIPQKES